MLPGSQGRIAMLQQMLDADSDRARADVLLRCPDSVLMKYAAEFTAACRRASFEAGEMFATTRISALLAVRDTAGLLPAALAKDLEDMRGALAVYAARPATLDV